jgi:hypothetical protein
VNGPPGGRALQICQTIVIWSFAPEMSTNKAKWTYFANMAMQYLQKKVDLKEEGLAGKIFL